MILRLVRPLVWALILFGNFAWANSSVQIVQTFPLETDLAIPGIQSTDQAWLSLIKSARTSIDIEQFYISSRTGELMSGVLDELLGAAARGVRVRVIVDSNFYSKFSNDPQMLSKFGQVEVRILDYSKIGGGVQHSKFFVVDRAHAYLGSANFDWLALSHIREVGIIFRNSNEAGNLQKVFEHDWNHAQVKLNEFSPRRRSFFEVLSERSETLITLLASPSQDLPLGLQSTLYQLLSMIQKAESSIQVQMYQYSTRYWTGGPSRWRVLHDAIQTAAHRGVHVQLLFDRASFKKDSDEISKLSSTPGIEVKKIEFPQWSGGPLDYARLAHSKYMIVDQKVSWIGSENWSENYFLSSRNVGAVIHASTAIADLDRVFRRLWSSSYALPYR